jgi:hypothetical protein
MKQIKPLISAAILAIALVVSTISAPTVDKRGLLNIDATVGNLLDTKIEALGKVRIGWPGIYKL